MFGIKRAIDFIEKKCSVNRELAKKNEQDIRDIKRALFVKYVGWYDTLLSMNRSDSEKTTVDLANDSIKAVDKKLDMLMEHLGLKIEFVSEHKKIVEKKKEDGIIE